MCYYLSMCSIPRKILFIKNQKLYGIEYVHIFFHILTYLHIYVHYSNLTIEKIKIKNVGPPVSHFSQAVYEQIKISIMSNKVC